MHSVDLIIWRCSGIAHLVLCLVLNHAVLFLDVETGRIETLLSITFVSMIDYGFFGGRQGFEFSSVCHPLFCISLAQNVCGPIQRILHWYDILRQHYNNGKTAVRWYKM